MASRFETFPEDEICTINAKKATNFGFSVFIACERRLPGGGYILRSEASRYLALLTDPEGDSCFSIYQISLRTADAFPVIFRRERSDDRKCVYCSQATVFTD